MALLLLSVCFAVLGAIALLPVAPIRPGAFAEYAMPGRVDRVEDKRRHVGFGLLVAAGVLGALGVVLEAAA